MTVKLSPFLLLFITTLCLTGQIQICLASQTQILTPNSVKKLFLPSNTLLEAPVVVVRRDDHVATVEMDYDPFAGHGGQLWRIGNDGTDPCGYRVQWWPDAEEASNIIAGAGCYTDQHTGTPQIATALNPHQVVSPNRVVQIQPIANHVTYHLRVEKLNGLGQVCSEAAEITFAGGDATRVQALRESLVFFDDFNLPMGPADEQKWNNAMGPQTDPRFNLFFVNHQCHTHTLNGTSNEGSGDRSQVAQRARKPLLIEEEVQRRIVFDMDGIFSGRSVWYLDLNPVQTDLMGHLSFFDADGDTGLPADVFRLRSQRNEFSVNLINSVGASTKLASVNLSDFGRALAPNVRRAFDVRLSTRAITILIDDTTVIDVDIPEGSFKPGPYYPLWSTVGYNTSKDDNPYFLSHWDNFGFDGPDISPYLVHNYVTRIAGTDLQKANARHDQLAEFTVHVPDDIRALSAGIKHEVWLVFSYQKDDFSSFNIQEGDHLLFNGNSFELPNGANNSSPLVPGLVDYSGSPISNRIKIGEADISNSPLLIGDNTIEFFATNTGIMNVHIEVLIPSNAAPPAYTAPADIHPFVHHHDLPKLGIPAKVVFINGQELSVEADTIIGPTVRDSMMVEILVGNENWANWTPESMHMPALSAEFWSSGSTKGIDYVELLLKSKNDSGPPQVIASLHTRRDAPAPQLRYVFEVDTRLFENGDYELFLQATNSDGVKSHPAYDGFGFRWDADEVSGAYYPVQIRIDNNANYLFSGTNGPLWTTNQSWELGLMPPLSCDGAIIIDANCQVPKNHNFEIGVNCLFTVNQGVTLEILK